MKACTIQRGSMIAHEKGMTSLHGMVSFQKFSAQDP